MPVDRELIAKEDAHITKSKLPEQALAKLSVNQAMPARPGYGSQGKKVLVYANYFKLIVPKELTLTRYNVEVSPDVTGKKLARVFELLLALPEFAGVATEWKSMIITKEALKITDGYTVEIPYAEEGNDEPLAKAIVYKVRVVTPLSFSISALVKFLGDPSPSAKFAHKVEAIQVMNALLGHHPQSKHGIVSIAHSRHYANDHSQANRQNIKQLGGGLEALRGYFQSVRAATGGLLLNVNVTHGVFLEPDRKLSNRNVYMSSQ